MMWVMALTKIGDNPDQSPWTIATFAEKPAVAIGETYEFDGEPDEKWLIEDIFPDHCR